MIVIFVFAGITNSQPPSHDPSHMVEDGGRYWIYTTGNGIWNMSSGTSDFTTWQPEPLVFSIGTWPGWINTYVSGFEGNFWAPDIFYMNDKWHLYYSCSTFGSRQSAIGLVTSSSLTSPVWGDQGMVVYTNNSSDHNAIDPAIFKDSEEKIWLVFGSWWSGIVITELDSTTGKPVNPSNLHYVANNGCEAGHVILHGGYYYLFFNRGACCSGIHSTYHILVGRSTSPTGPFYDKDGVNTNNNGGTLFLHSDGRYVGPGHFGYGEGKLTYHYYDGGNNGAALLKIATLDWEDDWPVAVYSGGGGLQGTWNLLNVNSEKMLGLEGADTASGTNVAQYTMSGDSSQIWEFTYLPGGYYKISPVLAPDNALEVVDCSMSNGANVQIGKYEAKECQQWFLAYMGAGVYRITARHSLKVLEIINAYTNDGANAQQWPYNEHETQRWQFLPPTIIDPVNSMFADQEELKIYPNPSDGSFTIDLTYPEGDRRINLEIYTAEGKQVFNQRYSNITTIKLDNLPNKGIYVVKITAENRIMIQKLIIQ